MFIHYNYNMVSVAFSVNKISFIKLPSIDQFEQQQQQQYGQQQPINIDMTTTDATLYHHCMQQPPYNYWSNDLNQSLSTAAATTATMDLNWFDYDATINLSASDIINENVVDIPIVDHQSDGISTTLTAEPTSSSLNQQDNWNDLNVIYSDIASHFTLVDPSSTTSTSTSSKIEQSIVDDQQSMVQIDYQLSNIVDTQNTELMENYYNNDQQMESNAIDQQYFNLHNHNNDEQLLNLNNNDNNNTIVDTTIDHQFDTNLFLANHHQQLFDNNDGFTTIDNCNHGNFNVDDTVMDHHHKIIAAAAAATANDNDDDNRDNIITLYDYY